MAIIIMCVSIIVINIIAVHLCIFFVVVTFSVVEVVDFVRRRSEFIVRVGTVIAIIYIVVAKHHASPKVSRHTPSQNLQGLSYMVRFRHPVTGGQQFHQLPCVRQRIWLSTLKEK